MQLFYITGIKGDDALDAIVEAPDYWHATELWLRWLDTLGDEPFPAGTTPYSVKPIPTGMGQRVIPWSEFTAGDEAIVTGESRYSFYRNQMGTDDNRTPMTPTDAKPCRVCNSPCRVETFGPHEHLEEPVSLWVCSNHQRFGGNCPSDLAYFDVEAWNARDPDELREALVDELIEAAKMSEAANRLTVPDQMFATKHLNEARLALLNSLTALSRNRGDEVTRA